LEAIYETTVTATAILTSTTTEVRVQHISPSKPDEYAVACAYQNSKGKGEFTYKILTDNNTTKVTERLLRTTEGTKLGSAPLPRGKRCTKKSALCFCKVKLSSEKRLIVFNYD